MKSPEIKGDKVLILGYGREGKSVHQFLLKNYPELKVSLADLAPIPHISLISPVKEIYSGKTYLDNLHEFDTVIRSPGIPVNTPQIQQYLKDGGHVTTATNIFFSLCPGTTIGVTGTKGKSTTSSLIAQILKTKFNDVHLVGNIGTPALDSLTPLPAKALATVGRTFFVIELSSHQLEDCRYSPHIAVILNIVPEHLDYYRTFKQYIQAKANIASHQTANDFVVFNPHYQIAAEIVKNSLAQKKIFSPGGQSFTDIPLKGNMENIQTAMAVASIFNISTGQIRQAISDFQPLPHRLENVGEFGGIRFYNDSLATIPEATIHALESLGNDVETLIAGGFDRGLDYAKLGKFLSTRSHLKTLILFPDTGEKIKQTVLASKGGTFRIYEVATMEEAVRLAYQHTRVGKICLLSPAAASFNIFKDYAARGEAFKSCVKRSRAPTGPLPAK